MSDLQALQGAATAGGLVGRYTVTVFNGLSGRYNEGCIKVRVVAAWTEQVRFRSHLRVFPTTDHSAACSNASFWIIAQAAA